MNPNNAANSNTHNKNASELLYCAVVAEKEFERYPETSQRETRKQIFCMLAVAITPNTAICEAHHLDMEMPLD
jgi:hypothetical protein